MSYAFKVVVAPTSPLTLAVNIGPLLENFSKLEFRSSERRAGSRRLAHASSLKGNSVTGHVFTLELNYLLWRRLLHLLSVKLLNTGNEKHSIITRRVLTLYSLETGGKNNITCLYQRIRILEYSYSLLKWILSFFINCKETISGQRMQI